MRARGPRRRSTLRDGCAAIAAPIVLTMLCACQPMPIKETPAIVEPATISIAQLYQRPPERALVSGLKLYEDGAFDRAEVSMKSALALGLRDRRDVGVAHKYLAFIACAFNRLIDCEQDFRAAIAVDPEFKLTDAEIGHPIWGPVYKRVVANPRLTEPAAAAVAPIRR